MLATAANSLVRLLLEPCCAVCRTGLQQPLTSPVCRACWRTVRGVSPPWCVRCGDALPPWRAIDPECPRCRRHPPRFALARSAGRYDGALREIIHVFKYERRRLLAEPLAEMMRGAGADILAGADAVVPVPLHPIRSLQRGFNQADDLARQLGLPVWRVLRRRRHGPPQASLPAAQRHANLREAFGLSMGWAVRSRLRHSPLRNSVVVVVDDVMTTGATLDACSRVLIAAGVRSVRALTAARAVAGPPPRPLPPPQASRPPHR
jgi:ComF family protein